MVNEFLYLIIGLLIGAIIIYFYLSRKILDRAEERARGIAEKLFDAQKDQLERSIHETYIAKLNEWKATELIETIKTERTDALQRARAVLKGKIGEQLAPLLPEFIELYNASDARFIGSPIDYLIFKNMTAEKDKELPIEVVLLDVKTGKSGLNRVQRRIKDAIEDGRVSFELIRLE